MIINVLSRYSKAIAWCWYFIFYAEWLFAAAGRPVPDRPFIHSGSYRHVATEPIFKPIETSAPGGPVVTAAFRKKPFGGGPTQPEMQAFSSVNANNMVDLFSGDFSYNIPLMDVGGYPINLAYRAGITMDQEASWVGLGWNVNPGTITRNLRGIPDDFNGHDSMRKVNAIKEDKTVGVTGGGSGDVELVGFPKTLDIGANLGIFHNTYKGWGLTNGLNATINAGSTASGGLTGGLGLDMDNNSQDGLTFTPSLSIKLNQMDEENNSMSSSSFTVGLPYNSRSGLKGLQLSMAGTQSKIDESNQRHSYSGNTSSTISFASAAYNPKINVPMTNHSYTFTAKLGLEAWTFHPSFFISGYVTNVGIADADTALSLPAYGYLHYQDGSNNRSALMDMNREKELVYRDKPAVPHIAVPLYTYDAFSITGEGTGGMFRAYRGDIGYVFDHFVRSKDASDKASVDVGGGNLVHGGVDLNVTRTFTQNSAWTDLNFLRNSVGFQKDTGLFEAAYFRNPGEKTINSKAYYNAIGGDDVVAAKLFQNNNSSSTIIATNNLTLYRNKRPIADSPMSVAKAMKPERDKRSQVISYLNAQEADVAGLNKYIENYTPNLFTLASCVTPSEDEEGTPLGLVGEYYPNKSFRGIPTVIKYDTIGMNWGRKAPNVPVPPGVIKWPIDTFSIRWTGRLKAPATGLYTIKTTSDDGIKLWLNDSSLVNDTRVHGPTDNSHIVYLEEGQLYKLRVDYNDQYGDASVALKWTYPGQSSFIGIARKWLYPPAADSFVVSNYVVKEKRINPFRKSNHISEIDVLNQDGRRYVYGIPVYNLKQKEASFSVNGKDRGNVNTGLVGYTHGTDNTTHNPNGNEGYYSSEEIPAYAHSFLLTGILSPDYVDLTGNGVSDDDKGDAVKFDYSKICGIGRPYRWRAPYTDSATFNEAMKTDRRDDKGNYVYGEKELWYLHTIQSKTMIATFVVENRKDLWAIDEAGHKIGDSSAKRLKEINLYTKADFIKNGVSARPIKTVHFVYGYDLCRGVNQPLNDSGKLTLKKVYFTYNGNKKGEQNPYIFNYNPLNPRYTIASYDRWGNYKDPAQNPSSSGTLTNAEYPYALQDSTLAAKNAAAWTLDSVKLPSGGAIKVTFEGDDFAYVQHKRAMNLFKLAGLGHDTLIGHSEPTLYGFYENLYVFVTVPTAVATKADLYRKYLDGVSKLYFKLFVRMPDDQWGTGSEYVSCYADLDAGNSYGVVNSNTIWVKISGISKPGDGPGNYSPLAKAATQFLRQNLPSKAYTGSEPGDNLDFASAVKMIFALGENIKNAFSSFDATARSHNWCTTVDLNRSYIRLDNPNYRKFGGGHRVKRITIYDRWDSMVVGQKGAKYGQEYTYTTQQDINGVKTNISSGVASYEPGIGGEENPFHQPIEYVEKIAPLGPTTLGYSEEPLGESVFPGAGIGYSKVRVRTINYKNIKSANGYEETTFYTAYDFPVFTDRSLIDNDTKKRYKPQLAQILRINARNYLTTSQGFKVELNDMHGKLRSQAYYPETDPDHYTTYTENIYRVEDPKAEQKRLSNVVSVMNPNGTIDTTALVGKDVELMMDMREQLSVTNGYNISVNSDAFAVPFIPPVAVIPSLIPLAQREEKLFRSIAALKVIQRYGILDSVIHVDKGSKVSTKDLLYDSETGDVLLTRTQNEFNDPVYNFNYPAHWAYDGMGPAYKNIGAVLRGVTFKRGKLLTNISPADTTFFSSGDEIIVAGKQKVKSVGCVDSAATFATYTKIWAVDSSSVNGGRKSMYFLDADGLPYSGNDVTIKIIRSGRRNMNSQVGSVTTLKNPLVPDGANGGYKLSLDSSSLVVNAGASEFRQLWKVEDRKRHKITVNCVDTLALDCTGGGTSCTCTCLKSLFSYLISSRRLFISPSDNIMVGTLVANANSAGFGINVDDCPVLKANQYKPFYAYTTDSVTQFYGARIGSAYVHWDLSDRANLYHFQAEACTGLRNIVFRNTVDAIINADTIQKVWGATKSLTYYDLGIGAPSFPGKAAPGKYVDTNTTKIIAAAQYETGAAALKGAESLSGGASPNATFNSDVYINSLIKWDSVSTIPSNATIVGAAISFAADLSGFNPTAYPNSHSIPNSFNYTVPSQDWSYTSYFPASSSLSYSGSIVGPFGPLSPDAFAIINKWRQDGNYGLNFTGNSDGTLEYVTFCSQRNSNAARRPVLYITYSVPADTQYITGTMNVFYKQTCDTIIDYSCNSVVTDTSFNPYTSGVLGNWRATRSYTYFGTRVETNPSTATNIRHNGAFHDFTPFWSFSNSVLGSHIDTTRWVWNSELTTFNPKGMEVENKDPLGRYNSILYGYNLTLPIAVTQNGRYRESAFEGFEDYGFLTQVCDTACPGNRHFDFSAFQSLLSTAEKHSGKSSLRLVPGAQVGLEFNLVATDTVQPKLSFLTAIDGCMPVAALNKIQIPNSILLPTFSPFKGKRMVISAWVKEDTSCTCSSYVFNDIKVHFTGGSSVTATFQPAGNIIEGWQRYEGVFTTPADATTMSVNLESTEGRTVYFDDLRIHPFNANMKSFVYNPVNLRLMAEQDENNYSTFYEYDDDGTLIRVKKETEKGIQTIKETRSALLKQ